ncbi:MAG: hypothetical protein OER82_03805 [Nitrosopumilus sp.]|nr:hypothetical protein [Nitrosopumilus sp.]
MACFLKGPASGYALGQIVQNRKKPNTKTLHTATTALKNAGYIIRDEKDRFCINPEMLVQTIEDEFLRKKRVTLSTKEKKIIADILANKGPFTFVSDQMISKIHGQEFRFHNIDALDMICDSLGGFAASFLVARKSVPTTNKEKQSLSESQNTFDLLNPIWNQMIPEITNAIQWSKNESVSAKNYMKKFPYTKSFEQNPTEDTGKIQEIFLNNVNAQREIIGNARKTKSHTKPISITKSFLNNVQVMMNSLPATKSFIELPEDTLIKLCSLWNQGSGFLFAWQSLNKK